MADKHFIIATAGHVDHGKSALVRTLTGTDPDRLPEEKVRGITIDLGFARLTLPAAAPSEDVFQLGIVDVPGHEDFVKNMVAGVGSVDAGLLVVAADDGWMPQTEEHLQILTYLGVQRAVVALTKIDRAQSPAVAEDQVRAKLKSSPFENAPIVATSIVTGQGLDDLRAAIGRVLADAPAPRDVGKPRLPVDRTFSLRGIGTVVTGTLTGGAFRRGGQVIAQPSGRIGQIRTLQNHGCYVETSGPGTRTALNLPDFEAAGRHAIGRGQVITLAEFGGASIAVDALLTRTARGTPAHADRPIKDGTHFRIYHGTGAWIARVQLLGGGVLLAPEQATARLHFETPIFAFAGDRFILRDGAEQATLAGGVVLDCDPGRRRLRSAVQRQFLERMATGSVLDVRGSITSTLERDHAVPRAGFLRRSAFAETTIAGAIADLARSGKVIATGELVIDANWWKTLLQSAVDFIDAWHGKHPERIGPPMNQLRRGLERGLPMPGVFDALIVALVAGGDCLRAGMVIRRASHRPVLPPNLRGAGDRLRNALSVKPFEPPSRKELAPDAVSRQALRYLCDTGETLELGDDLVLPQESYQRMKTIITRMLRSTGSATASELRQVLGTTRRVIIPLLEALDREGLTRREGDRRFLK